MKKKRKWKDDSTESQIAKELLDNYNYEFQYNYSKAKDRKRKTWKHRTMLIKKFKGLDP